MKVGKSFLIDDGQGRAEIVTSVQLSRDIFPLSVGERGLFMAVGNYWRVFDPQGQEFWHYDIGHGIPGCLLEAIEKTAKTACFAGYRVVGLDEEAVRVDIVFRFDTALAPMGEEGETAFYLMRGFRDILSDRRGETMLAAA